MAFHSNCSEDSNNKKKSKINTRLSSQANEKKKLGSILNFDECDRTNGDLHPQVLKNAEKSTWKQQVERNSQESGELVMYMSCLPSYLERGQNPQEKPFNIGVLDWGMLQKWQCNNDFFDIKNEHPSFTSNSTLISSKGFSSYCSSNPLKVHQSSSQLTQSSGADTVNRLSDSTSKDQELPKVSRTKLKPLETDAFVSVFKGNGIHRAEASNTKEQLLSSDGNFPVRLNATVPKSRNDLGSRHPAACSQSYSSKGDKSRSLEENQYTFYGGSSVKICHGKLRSERTPRFYSVASEHGKTKDSLVEKSFVKETRSFDRPSGKEETTQFTESASVSPSRKKDLEKKNSGSMPKNLAEDDKFQMEVGKSASSKVRNPSPIRRFSFGMGRIGKSSNLNSSATANLVSEKVTSTSACSNYSTIDKSNAANRARSSPLRRLLDPLLKPKGVDSDDIVRSSERNPLKTERTIRSSCGQIDSAALHPVKRSLNFNGSRVDDIGGPHHARKNQASSTQAILQVAVKHGLPLFTFSVDNCSDILAATVKELSSNKVAHGWIYTFFSFKEAKKKNGGHWINQGSKDRNQGYIPNIVAQMNVSNIQYADSRREFVLSSAGANNVDQASDSFPGDELAAIVVKFPERTSLQRGTLSIPQARSCLNSGDSEGNGSACYGILSMTVILPGGHHGAPSKGEPSPLIERWKSGGSCDCGGWDLGCQLRIIDNNHQSSQRFKSTKSQLTAFELFSQEEVEEEGPTFALLPFEDGIFSVEFNSSLKLIQAFSIGVAVLHNRTSAILSSNTSGGKMCDEMAVSENSVWKSFNQAEIEVSAKFAAIPPLSPVGRV